jgi:hypothetical protein
MHHKRISLDQTLPGAGMIAPISEHLQLSQSLFTIMHTKSTFNMNRDLRRGKRTTSFLEAKTVTMDHHCHDKPVVNSLAVGSLVWNVISNCGNQVYSLLMHRQQWRLIHGALVMSRIRQGQHWSKRYRNEHQAIANLIAQCLLGCISKIRKMLLRPLSNVTKTKNSSTWAGRMHPSCQTTRSLSRD